MTENEKSLGEHAVKMNNGRQTTQTDKKKGCKVPGEFQKRDKVNKNCL